MKKVLFLAFLFFALVFAACKKDSSSPTSTPPPIPTPGAIAGIYKISALKVQVSSTEQADVYNELTECQKNDTWGFQEDGNFLFGGAAAADCGDPDLSGTWSLDEHIFTITTSESSDAYQFVNFDGKLLKLSIEGTYNDAPATYYISFLKQ